MPATVQKSTKPLWGTTVSSLVAVAILITVGHPLQPGRRDVVHDFQRDDLRDPPARSGRIRRLSRRFERSGERRGHRRQQRGRVAGAGDGSLGVERTRSGPFLQNARHRDSGKVADQPWAVPQDHQGAEPPEAGFELVSDKPWSARRFPSFAKWLAERQELLDRAVEASKRPRCYLPLIRPATSEIANDLPLAAVRAASTIGEAVAARATLRLNDGKTLEASQDLLACHRLARLLRQWAAADGLVDRSRYRERGRSRRQRALAKRQTERGRRARLSRRTPPPSSGPQRRRAFRSWGSTAAARLYDRNLSQSGSPLDEMDVHPPLAQRVGEPLCRRLERSPAGGQHRLGPLGTCPAVAKRGGAAETN